MNPWDIAAVALLTLLGFVLGGGVTLVLVVRKHLRQRRRLVGPDVEQSFLSHDSSRFSLLPYNPLHPQRPAAWLAIRSRDTLAVQAALKLNNARPCQWNESSFSASKLFIAPPVHGWTIVFGAALPTPTEDVDVCFRFLHQLSLKLGHVQFFQANHILQHHAWAQLESGRVLRAYAWSGATTWNQGLKTADEITLGMNCFGYGENPASDDWVMADHIVANVEKIPQLAARWSFDPGEVDLRMIGHQSGISGTTAGMS